MASNEIMRALAVCAELCGANLSEGAAKVIVAELENEREDDVLAGLTAMRREHDGRFSLASVLRFVRAAQRERVASQQTCYLCGAPATKGSLCDEHHEHERKWNEGAKKISTLIPTALVPRKSV